MIFYIHTHIITVVMEQENAGELYQTLVQSPISVIGTPTAFSTAIKPPGDWSDKHGAISDGMDTSIVRDKLGDRTNFE